MGDETVSIDRMVYNSMLFNGDLLVLLLDKQNRERELRKERQKKYYLKHSERLKNYSKEYYQKFKLGHQSTHPGPSE